LYVPYSIQLFVTLSETKGYSTFSFVILSGAKGYCTFFVTLSETKKGFTQRRQDQFRRRKDICGFALLSAFAVKLTAESAEIRKENAKL
jgi:hypothetical protein